MRSSDTTTPFAILAGVVIADVLTHPGRFRAASNALGSSLLAPPGGYEAYLLDHYRGEPAEEESYTPPTPIPPPRSSDLAPAGMRPALRHLEPGWHGDELVGEWLPTTPCSLVVFDEGEEDPRRSRLGDGS